MTRKLDKKIGRLKIIFVLITILYSGSIMLILIDKMNTITKLAFLICYVIGLRYLWDLYQSIIVIILDKQYDKLYYSIMLKKEKISEEHQREFFELEKYQELNQRRLKLDSEIWNIRRDRIKRCLELEKML